MLGIGHGPGEIWRGMIGFEIVSGVKRKMMKKTKKSWEEKGGKSHGEDEIQGGGGGPW